VSSAVVIPLLVIAGVLNIAGTATVAFNYWQGTRLGNTIDRELESRASAPEGFPPVFEYIHAGEIDTGRIANDLIGIRRRVASYLKPRPIFVVGLICYALGAILDTVAGVGALLR